MNLQLKISYSLLVCIDRTDCVFLYQVTNSDYIIIIYSETHQFHEFMNGYVKKREEWIITPATPQDQDVTTPTLPTSSPKTPINDDSGSRIAVSIDLGNINEIGERIRTCSNTDTKIIVNKGTDKMMDNINKIRLTSDAPISTIIKELKEEIDSATNDHRIVLTEMYMAATRIFLKYITDDAYFAINLPFQVKSELYDIFGYLSIDKNNVSNKSEIQQMVEYMALHEVSINDLENVFDEARKEVFRLMSSSFSRFKTTDQYKKRNLIEL